MTAPTLELQAAIVAAVEGDSAIMALITGIYDSDATEQWGDKLAYLTFGPEDTITETAGCFALDDVSVQIDVWTRIPGRARCKEILHELTRIMATVVTSENPIVSRSEPFSQVRRDPDGITVHGVYRAEFGMEKNG